MDDPHTGIWRVYSRSNTDRSKLVNCVRGIIRLSLKNINMRCDLKTINTIHGPLGFSVVTLAGSSIKFESRPKKVGGVDGNILVAPRAHRYSSDSFHQLGTHAIFNMAIVVTIVAVEKTNDFIQYTMHWRRWRWLNGRWRYNSP